MQGKNYFSKIFQFIFLLDLFLSLHALSSNYEEICHVNFRYPKAITLTDSNILLLSTSTSTSTKTSIMSLYSEEATAIYGNKTFSKSFSGNSELVHLTNSSLNETKNKYFLVHHDSQDVSGHENKEFGVMFEDEFNLPNALTLSNSLYQKISLCSLKDGYLAIASINKNPSNVGKVTAALSLLKSGSSKIAVTDTFNAYSKFISCFETAKGEIYCAYVGYEDKFITKLSLRHYSYTCGLDKKNYTKNETIRVNVTKEDPPKEEKQTYDLLYLIDSTGSMSGTIASAKKYSIEIANKLKESLKDYDFKYGAIFYKDSVATKGSNKESHIDFTSDMTQFQKFVNSIQANGGESTPAEDWVEAYSVAEKLSWRNGIKLIIHIADYGAHGKGYSNDKYTDQGPLLDKIALRLCNMENLYIKAFKIRNDSSSSFDRINNLCKQQKKDILTKKGFDANDLSITDFVTTQTFDQNSKKQEEFVEMIVSSTYEVINNKCTLSLESEQNIKSFHNKLNYLKVKSIEEKEFVVLFQSGKHDTPRKYGEEGNGLYYYRFKIEDDGKINGLRYEYLYDNCLYKENSESYNADIAILSKNKIIVVCENKEKKLHGMIITKDKEEIEHFDFIGNDLSYPVLAKFGQSTGVFYSKSSKTTALQLLNYPFCSNINQLLVPIYLGNEIDLEKSIYFINPYPNTRSNEQVFYKWKKIPNNLLIKHGEDDLTSSTSYLPYKIRIESTSYGIKNIEFTTLIKDSVDGEIFGKTCQIQIKTPGECLPQCYSCYDKGTAIHNSCLGHCNKGYYKEEDETMPQTPFGNPFNCPKCADGCLECEKGPSQSSKNCLICDNAKGYYYVEEDKSNCLNETEIREYEKIKDNAYFLYDNKTIGEKYWKKCHYNCGSCSMYPTEKNNTCDTCRNNYHFFFNQTKTNYTIPGNCYTGYEDKGYFVNTDNKYHPCLSHCRKCHNKDTCDKCFENFFLYLGNQCNTECPFYLAYDRNLWECVNCKNRYNLPKYNHKQICYDEILPGYHVYNDTYNLITICDPEGRCFTCIEEGTAKCTECNSTFYKEHFLDNRTYFNCYTYEECKEDGVPDFTIHPKLCRNCKLENPSKYRAVNDLSCISPQPNRTYIKNTTYNSLDKCYTSCETCHGRGNVENHNCIECREPTKYEIFKDKEKNIFCTRIIILPCQGGLYYHDYDLGDGEDVCVEGGVCPPDYPFLTLQTHECVQHCKFEEFFNNICSLSDVSSVFSYLENPFNVFNLNISIKGTVFESIVTNVLEKKFSGDFLSSLKLDIDFDIEAFSQIIKSGKAFSLPSTQIFKGSNDDYKIEFTSTGLQKKELEKLISKGNLNSTEIEKGKTIVELCECDKKLKDYYGLSLDEDLLIIKGDILRNDLLSYCPTQVEYIVFSTSLGKKLDLSVCKKDNLLINILQKFDPILLGSSLSSLRNLEENDNNYRDKVKNVIDEGYDPFDSNGEFYMDDCSPFTSEYGTDVTIEDRKNTYFSDQVELCEDGCEYKGINKTTNMYLCQCLIKDTISQTNSKNIKFITNSKSEEFNKKKKYSNIDIIKCHNKVFSLKGQKDNIGSLVLFILFVAFIITSLIYFIRGNKMVVNLFKSITPQSGEDNKKEEQNNNQPKSAVPDSEKGDGTNDVVKKNNQENADKHSLNDEELNGTDYAYALEHDKRNYIQYYCSLIKLKQILIFTFCTKTDHNLRIVKIALFALFVSFFFAFNALFYTDSIISSVYQYKGNLLAAIHIPNIIFSSLGCLIMFFLIRLITLSEKDIMKIRYENDINKAQEAAGKTSKCLKIKVGILFSISILLLACFWYYVAAFCAVFKNSQIHYLCNILICFILCNLWPFVTCLFAPIFRIISLKNGKSEGMYKFSQILAYI